jgi:hypothetical protein
LSREPTFEHHGQQDDEKDRSREHACALGIRWWGRCFELYRKEGRDACRNNTSWSDQSHKEPFVQRKLSADRRDVNEKWTDDQRHDCHERQTPESEGK